MPISGILRQRYGGVPIAPQTFDAEFTAEPADRGVETEEGPGIGTALMGAGALGAAALAARNPAIARSAIGRLGSLLSGVRYASMLSGFAPLKSILGNIGAAGVGSLERRSLRPLTEFFNPKTVRAFVREVRTPTTPEAFGQATSRFNPFGRVMGAGDIATREALERAGLGAEGAERLVLQSPKYITGATKRALETPVGRFLVPFRRTGFNQFFSGMQPETFAEHPAIWAGAAGTGEALGRSDLDPRTIALLAPLASVYTLPFVLGATHGRFNTRPGETSAVLGGLSPISEFGLQRSVSEPFRPFYEPSALRALKYLRGE